MSRKAWYFRETNESVWSEEKRTVEEGVLYSRHRCGPVIWNEDGGARRFNTHASPRRSLEQSRVSLQILVTLATDQKGHAILVVSS